MQEIKGRNYGWLAIKEAGGFSWGIRKGMNGTGKQFRGKINYIVKNCLLKEQVRRKRKIKGSEI